MRPGLARSFALALAAAIGCGGGGTASPVDASSGGAGGASSDGASSGGVTGASGGRSGSGGAPAASGGRSGSGGATATGGAPGSGGAGGRAGCKRGIAANIAPGTAFFPAITWWYNWSLKPSGGNTGIEFAPMVWNATTVNGAIPTGSRFLLGFNEPNFHAQANLTPQQAAAAWPALQANATAAGAATVSPAMNFCGPAANCNGTDPYEYLKAFFAACSGCRVDYVAVHWYNCDLPSLRDYLEPGGNLEGFEQFGRPIWLTEFSCDGNATVAQQEAFMRVAIPYLEGKADVFRYSWFSADPIPNARLINADGSPTALGQTYAGLPQSCP